MSKNKTQTHGATEAELFTGAFRGLLEHTDLDIETVKNITRQELGI